MTSAAIDIELTGELRVLEALAGVSRQAGFAQKTALRAAGRKGRSLIAKGLAARHQVPLRVFRHRVRFFNKRARGSKAPPVAVARLWGGFEAQIKANEHKKVENAIRAQHPRGFNARMPSGHGGWFHRTAPSRRVGAGARTRPHARGALPIKEHTLDYSRGADALMLDSARRVMRTIYPDTFRKDYKRRIDKIRARNR